MSLKTVFMIKCIMLACGLFFAGCKGSKNVLSFGNYPNVKIYEASDQKGIGPCEPSLFINPKDPSQMVAGSVLDFVHRSQDGGKTWTTNALKSALGVWGDPVITADYLGNFYYFHLSDPEGTNWNSSKILDRIVVQKSEDGGKTWTSGTGIGHRPPKQQDKEWATTNPMTGSLYTTWTEFDHYGSRDPDDKSRILFSRSTDQGESWSAPVVISQHQGTCIDDDSTVEGAVPASDGQNIYVVWAYDHNIWFDYSNDDGQTWQTRDRVVVTQQSGWDFKIPGCNRANGMPVTAVDNSSSKYKGTVYINWSDQSSPEDTDIYICKSTDQGKNWSSPVRVNKDKTKTHQFFSWMCVDPVSGYVYVLYYDRSRYEDQKTDVVLAVSKDGGNTFSNTTISEHPFDPTGCSFFGDYTNVTAFDGVVRPIWTHYQDRKLSVWTALIDQK